MAGANGIQKYALWNREDQFENLKTYGVIYNEPDLNLVGVNPPVPTNSFAAALMTPAELLADWVITAATAPALTAPSNLAVNTLFEQLTKYEVGSSITMTIVNNDAASHTVFFPAGYTVTPNPLTIPANSVGHITLMLTNSNTCQFQVTDFYFGTSGGSTGLILPPGVVIGDLLEWSGTAWGPSSAVNAPGQLNFVQPFPNPAVSFMKFWDFSGMNINFFLGGGGVRTGVIRGFQAANDDILGVSVPDYTATNEAGIRALNGTVSLNPVTAFLYDSSFTSEYQSVNTAAFPAAGTMCSVWHFLGLVDNALPTVNSPVGLCVDGQFFGLAFNVTSDRRLKKNIKAVKLDSKKLREYQISQYHMKTQSDDSPLRLGLIADDIEKVLPDAYGKPKDENTAAGIQVMPLLTAVLGYAQDLESRVSDLENQLREMSLQLKSLMAPAVKSVKV